MAPASTRDGELPESLDRPRSNPMVGCDSKKPVQEGSIGLVVFGAGHVNRAEPPELFKGGAFEKLAKRPESPVSAKAPALNARGDLSSPHGRR